MDDHYGSEFEDPDLPLNGGENTLSEFDTNLLSDIRMGNPQIQYSASQVMKPSEAVGCSFALFIRLSKRYSQEACLFPYLFSL